MLSVIESHPQQRIEDMNHAQHRERSDRPGAIVVSRVYSLPCGCTVDRATDHYVAMCAEHEATWAATHQLAHQQRTESRQEPPG